MTIQFQCKCGKRLEIDDEHAGKEARCPACNATVPVPTLTSSAGASSLPPRPSSISVEETPVEFVKVRIAEGMSENPMRTKILVVLGCWQALLLAAMFVGAFMPGATSIMWLFIWVPLVAFMEYCVYRNLKGDSLGRVLLLAGTFFSGGVSWTYLLLAVANLTASPIPAAVTFICSFLNLLGCAGLVWYFGRNQLSDSVVKEDSENNGAEGGVEPQQEKDPS